jgi:hypothetical protein
MASVIASVPTYNAGPSQPHGINDPLVQLRATVEIYRRLLTDDPTNIFAEFLNDDALGGLELSRKNELMSLINRFMEMQDSRNQSA